MIPTVGTCVCMKQITMIANCYNVFSAPDEDLIEEDIFDELGITTTKSRRW